MDGNKYSRFFLPIITQEAVLAHEMNSCEIIIQV